MERNLINCDRNGIVKNYFKMERKLIFVRFKSQQLHVKYDFLLLTQ